MKSLQKARRNRLLALGGLAAGALILGLWFQNARNDGEIRQLSGSASPLAGPNVLLITIDTLRADALGSYGNRDADTAVLDRLAAAGVRFERAYAHNVVTLPSHANILAGRLPFAHGVRDNSGFRMPASMPTLATILKSRGYRTGAFVSAFPLDSRFGLDRGFDVYEDRFADAARPAFLEQERRGTETVRLARDWIASSPGGPYFCWVHLYEPHFPYAPTEPFASRFSGRPYDGEVAAVDAALAPLLEPVMTPGSSTLVVFTSDHGESLGDHGEASHGIFAYEPTLKVPLVFYDPRWTGPSVVQTPASHVDILPTVLAALGIDVPPDLDGRVLDVRAPGGGTGRPVYFEALSGMLNRGWAPLRGVVSGSRKYIDLPIPELYDLDRDPREQRNLAAVEPERVASLRRLLGRWPSSERMTREARDSGEIRERLRSLGYIGSEAPARPHYTEADDPKRLIAVDADLHDVVAQYLAGDRRGALDRCRAIVARWPKMPMSLLYLAHLEREDGNLPAGIDALRRAASLNPGDTETLSLLGAYLTDAGRAIEAVALLEPLAREPEPDPQVLLSAGLALARAGRGSEAVALLERARAADPSNAGVLVHIGTVHLMAGRPAEARAAFERAVAINPGLARAHSSLGALAAEAGQSDLALTHWRRAVSLDDSEFRTVLGVAVGLANRGRAAEARPYVEFFVDAAPQSRYAAEIAKAREWLRR